VQDSGINFPRNGDRKH